MYLVGLDSSRKEFCSPRLLSAELRKMVVLLCFGSRGATAAAFAMNEDFSRTLENQMDIFNSPDGDQVRFQKIV